jgi:hypothetical protein
MREPAAEALYSALGGGTKNYIPGLGGAVDPEQHPLAYVIREADQATVRHFIMNDFYTGYAAIRKDIANGRVPGNYSNLYTTARNQINYFLAATNNVPTNGSGLLKEQRTFSMFPDVEREQVMH